MDSKSPRKVLILHRDAGATCAYTAIARSAGWEASSCEEIGDVVGAIRDDDADVLIFDFAPERGFEALRKAHNVDKSLPTILITAHPVDHGEAMSLGVKMIFPKPPNPAELRQGLAALATKLPASDFKVLFEFLERCDAAKSRMR